MKAKILFLLAVTPAFLCARVNTLSPGDPPSGDNNVWITVFVHGIMSIKPHLSVENFMRLMNDQVEDSLYAKTIEYMRQDPVFFKNQAMQRPGLHKIQPNVEQGNASGALAYLMKNLEKHYNISHAEDHFYTFGWSGLLSNKARYLEAQRLFDALEQLVAQFQKKRGITPKIRLFGYSHGGNVLLNLGAVHRNLHPESNLRIAQTVLMGTPIQRESDYLAGDPVFEKVYHFYSRKDRVQPLDLFSSSRYFSHQIFKPRQEFKVPDNVVQINVKVFRPAKSATNKKQMALAQDYKNPRIVYGNSHLIRETSPGHSELWFFAWTPMHYRKKYPLYPFPTVAYAPLIIHEAEKIKDEVPPHESIIADIRPAFGVMLMRPQGSLKIYERIALPDQSLLDQLRGHIFKYEPPDYNDALYKKHTKIAFEKAQQWEGEIKKGLRCPHCGDSITQ